MRELDWALVFSITESARTIGFLHPIAVREHQIERKGKLRTKTVLVAGAHRLAAARRLSYERIDCIYIDYNDDTTVKLVQIGEDLFRKQLTVLRHAELLTKWYRLVSKDFVYGQFDRKNKRGRPPNGVWRIARDLFNISVDAWRKRLRRAQQIARIQPEAKQAAIDAGLHDNQQALLVIAAAKGGKAQLRKVARLAQPSGDAQEAAAKPAADGNAASSEQSDTERSDTEQSDTEQPDKDQEQGAKPSQPETSFEQIEQLWKKHFHKLWIYMPFGERERFMCMLRRARSKARTNSLQFVKKVFQGRKKVYARDLYALAEAQGLSKTAVRTVLNGLGYHRKRSGYGSAGRYYYRNTNPNWKEEMPVYSESELMGGRKRGIVSRSNEAERAENAESENDKAFEEARPPRSAGTKAVLSDDDYLLY